VLGSLRTVDSFNKIVALPKEYKQGKRKKFIVIKKLFIQRPSLSCFTA